MISRHLIQPYNKLVNKKTTPKTHLILFLSPLPKTFRRSQSTEDDTSTFPLLDEFKERAENWRKMDKSMENQGINWEMSYRSIHSQLFPSSDLPSKLQQVIVALSAPSKNKKGDKVDGSAAMVAEFFEGLQALMMLWNVSQPPQLKLLIKRENSSEKPFELTTFEPGKNYEMLGINSADFEETSAAVFFAVHTLIQQQVTESDIVIDITGWQKHTSVAGVLVATVTDVHNQYVDTNSKEVISYDFTFNDFTKLT
ncbi:hypothetical protein EMM73_03530 [Rheinheimera sediminis]|uniref:hypothetical protein n=1 Tax=Rheinheimera sp. YQF-1 TaxID=2499626 RepID=UPI000FD8EAD2|nr:hypothetical protein [Rheinheimera sp. YQF-1]RVT47835.1 hypothetical protein EMM73_03530 [Rheinheimera sp. YQF-1]